MKLKGILIITVPVGNIPNNIKIRKYLDKVMIEMMSTKLRKQINSAGYVIYFLPSRKATDPKIEQVVF